MARKRNRRPLRKKLPLRKRKDNPRYIRLSRAAGHPPKLSEELIVEFVKVILEGLPIEKCCDYLGVSRQAYYEWKVRGEKFLFKRDSGAKPEHPDDELHAIFVQSVSRAEASWQLDKHRNSLQNNSKNKSDWVRDITQLERRDRRHWSRSETVSVTDTTPLPDEAYL